MFWSIMVHTFRQAPFRATLAGIFLVVAVTVSAAALRLVVLLDEVHHQEIPPGSWSVEPCSVDTDGCVSLVGAGLSPPVLTYYRHQINFADIPGLDRGQSLTVWYTHREQFGIMRRYGTVQGASQAGFVVVDPVHTHLSRHRLAGLLTACALLLALLGVPLLVWRPVFAALQASMNGPL